MNLSQDIPKLYTAAAEWLCTLSVILAWLRATGKKDPGRLTFTLGAGLFLLCLLQTFCGMVTGPIWLLGMLLCVLVMLGILHFSLGVSAPLTLFMGARAFLWAEFMAALEWELDRFYVPAGWENNHLYSLSVCLLVFGANSLLLWFLERRYVPKEPEDMMPKADGSMVALVWFITLSIFCLSNLSYVEVSLPFRATNLPDIFNIRAIIDLAGVVMIEAFFAKASRDDKEKELDAIRNVLNAQYLQFRVSQENMDLVNCKYHDMKHLLQVLRSQDASEKMLPYLEEAEEELRLYEAEYSTGNSVLDTILTSKGYRCLKLGIQMKVVADGSLLSHLHVMDIATIFGNALDNALEHESQIPEKEKRLIRVSLSRHGQMALLLIENYFQGELLEDSFGLVTTKKDKRYHGYGVKSIRYAVQKYHGIMTTGVEDGWFRLKILIPLP